MDFYKYELLRKCIDKIYNIHILINEDDNDNNYSDDENTIDYERYSYYNSDSEDSYW